MRLRWGDGWHGTKGERGFVERIGLSESLAPDTFLRQHTHLSTARQKGAAGTVLHFFFMAYDVVYRKTHPVVLRSVAVLPGDQGIFRRSPRRQNSRAPGFVRPTVAYFEDFVHFVLCTYRRHCTVGTVCTLLAPSHQPFLQVKPA